MYVEQIMTRNVAKCSEDTRVTHLSGMMHEHCIHHLPVFLLCTNLISNPSCCTKNS